MVALFRISASSTTLSAAHTYVIVNANADVGTVRMKSLHIDLCFSPNAAATKPAVVQVCLHRVHADVPNANLLENEGSRVKYEQVTIGRTTDRYYRMWLKQINLEFGYHLVLDLNGTDVGAGNPSYALGARWWELIPE